MAVAEKLMSARFNKGDHTLVDHRTWCFVGDGCLMEGVSHETCSLAGTLGLGKLTVIYDDNGISIDGEIEGWFTDDTPARFAAYGWHVIPNVDGHSSEAVEQAIDSAIAETSRPTIICCKTMIGKGSPNKQGTESCHGAPLGEGEIGLTREALGWPYEPFVIPEDVYAHWDARDTGVRAEAVWTAVLEKYRAEHPELAGEFERRMKGELPSEFMRSVDDFIAQCVANESDVASRKASQQAIAALAPTLPELLGGSADLAGSNLTLWPEAQGADASDAGGNYIYYGVREFAMAAMMNGISLHGGFIPFGGTFLIFMEYARNAVRMASLMRQRAIYVFTHDSVGLGEDGPTHQPVEQLASMRSTPNLDTWRPCDAVESAIAWKQAIIREDGPSALVFSRQTLPHQVGAAERVSDVGRGAYILREEQGELEAIVIATGSEVALAIEAAEKLSAAGRGIRVVSMPCADVFERQDAVYRESVLPSHILARVAVEASHMDWWYKYVGLDGRVVGMSSFGESAPGPQLMKEFGFTVENVVDAIEDVILS
jgi:transketolase